MNLANSLEKIIYQKFKFFALTFCVIRDLASNTPFSALRIATNRSTSTISVLINSSYCCCIFSSSKNGLSDVIVRGN